VTLTLRTLAFGTFVSVSSSLGSFPAAHVATAPGGGLASVPAPDVTPVVPKVRQVDTLLSFDETDVECLALNIYHEARSEPPRGQLAVAAVTLNRLHSPAYPDSVCAVVKQGGQRRHACQFSWWCDGKSDEPTEKRPWGRALAMARRSLLGLAEDPTGGATHYHATYVDPFWAAHLEHTVQIGRHLFYRTGRQPLLQLASIDSPDAS